MRVRYLAASAAVAALTVLAPLTAAHTAEGEITFDDPLYGLGQISDPEAGECHPMVIAEFAPPAQRVTNYTEATVAMFDTIDCTGDPEMIEPFSASLVPGRSFVVSR